MELTFPESELFCINGSNIGVNEGGASLDSVLNNISVYEDIIPESGGQKIIDAIITLNQGYLGHTSGGWDNDSHVHGGVGLRYNGSSSDMAGLIMLSAEAGELQAVDRFGGTEYIVFRRSIAGGISYGQPYRLLIECTSGDSVRVRLYNATTGALLDDHSYTLTVGSTATGTPFAHTFAAKMTINNFGLRTSADVPVISSDVETYASLYSAAAPRLLCASGALDMFSNGANGSVNSWAFALSPVKRGSIKVTGSMKRVSATRNIGFLLRHNGVSGGTCYVLYHDTSGGLKFGRFSGTTLTTIQTSAKTLTTGVNYPFTLTVSGNDYTLVVDGTTFGPFTDTTYVADGFFGFLGFQANNQFSDIHILEAPAITSHPSGATKDAGESVTFSVTATGDPAPTYQWRKDGVNIGGATSADYTIPSVSESDAGDYDVVVTNSEGSATSNVATLTVNSATSNWWIKDFRRWRRR